MSYEIQVEELSSVPLAVVRRRARQDQLAKIVPEACGLVWKMIREHNISGAGRHVALYWDGEINLEVGVELETPFAGQGEVVASATPAGKTARTAHFGPYNRLHEAHKAIHGWCAKNGY